MSDLFNRYIDYTVDFTSNNATISGDWNQLVNGNAFIIGNSNAAFGSIILFSQGIKVYITDFAIDEYIQIIKFNKSYVFDSITILLRGISSLYVGLLFIGETWELPRFVVNPEKNMRLRGTSDRTFSGQAMGIPAEILRAFAGEFIRIGNEEVRKVEKYVQGVQNVIPHVIDIYPEAHDDFPPLFGTLSDYGSQTKRAENGFYWDYQMSWREAR